VSHWPGPTLENYLTDVLRLAVPGHSTAIRATLYASQRILEPSQFAEVVRLAEPYRDDIERLLLDYDEEDNGSWRDYHDFMVDERIPEAVWAAMECAVESFQPATTRGIADAGASGPPPPPATPSREDVMSELTVGCVACYWDRQRRHDPLATIHEVEGGAWVVHYSNGDVGPVVHGTTSNHPRTCICGVEGGQPRGEM